MDSLACGADRFGHLGARLTFRLWSRRLSYVKRLKCLLVCLPLTLAGRYALGQSATGDAAGQRWWAHIQFHADDTLEGRDVGSRKPLGVNSAVSRLEANNPRMTSLVKNSIPQSVWWMTKNSRVPSSL